MKRVTFVFAPGAGAPSSHPWMASWAERLETLGRVYRFDYRYMTEGKKRPDPLPVLIAAHCEALEAAQVLSQDPIVLIGKSMGSRIGCHVALKTKVLALVCLSYPLCAGGDPSKMRDKVLRGLATPILFVQGSRDPLCPLDLLERVRREMSAPNEIFVVGEGDHSLLVTKRELKARNETQEEVDQRILDSIRIFLDRILEG